MTNTKPVSILHRVAAGSLGDMGDADEARSLAAYCEMVEAALAAEWPECLRVEVERPDTYAGLVPGDDYYEAMRRADVAEQDIRDTVMGITGRIWTGGEWLRQ